MRKEGSGNVNKEGKKIKLSEGKKELKKEMETEGRQED